ncbi:MAG: ABC transporter ATP-binding protein [Anaerolineales bacterium]|nr:ABC transporter ATP-binding protein [Anaerolineales bacterium]
MSQPIIAIQQLVRRFATGSGAVTAVDHLDLIIQPGEIYGLVGPDGAGKTTLFRLLVGALRLDGGGGQIVGCDLAREMEKIRRQIGYLPQRFSLYGDLTVGENLRFFAEVNNIAAADWQQRQREMLDFVGLSEFEGRLARNLSGGMKQKLGLATALIHRPRLLLLDEPTGGVDPVTRQDFWQLIGRAVTQEGVTVVVSTPYMDEASRCTRIGFMNAGRILAEGTVKELTAPLNGRILELVGTNPRQLRQLCEQDPDVEAVQAFGSKLHLRVRRDGVTAVQQRLPQTAASASIALTRLRPIAPTLEDVFIELLEE